MSLIRRISSARIGRVARLTLLSRASLYFLLGLGAASAGVATGLVVLIKASNPASGADDIQRYVPLAYGTTHIYAVKQDGSDVRWKSVQVKGPSFVGLDAEDQNGWVVETRDLDSANALIGVPTSLYLLRDSHTLYFAGSRFGRSSVTESPKRAIFEIPVQAGARMEWEADDDVPAFFSKSTTTDILGLETVNVMGQDRQDCVHSRSAATFLDDSDVEHTQTTEDWVCPGLGTVRTIEDAPTVQYHREETLVAFRGPGGNEGLAVGPLAISEESATLPASTTPSWTIDRRTRSELAPLAAGGFVYFAESDGTLTAFNERSGTVAWSLIVDRPITIQPVMAGDVVAVSDRTRVLWGFDRGTGLARWSLPLDDFPTNPPVAAAGTIVVTIETGEILGVDAASGAINWRTHADGPVLATPVLTGEGVAIAYADGGLAMLDPKTGAVKWSRDLDGQPGNPAAGHGRVAVTIDESRIQVFDARDGRLMFTSTTDERPVSDPAIADGSVYAVAGDVLAAVDAETGDRRWRATVGATSWAPMFVAGAVHVLTDDGTLVSVDASSGAVLESGQLVAGESTDLLVFPTVEGDRILTGAGASAPWIHTSYRSIPVGEAKPEWVTFDAAVTEIPVGPWPKPVVVDRGTLVLGDDNVLRVVATSGVTIDVYKASDRSQILVATGDTAVIEEGADAVAVALDGSGVRWRYDLGAEFQLDVSIDGGAFYAVTAASRLVALDLASGHLLWEHPLAGMGLAPPLPDGAGGILLSAGGKVSRLDVKTGVVAWSSAPDAYGRMAVSDGVVFYPNLASSKPGLTALSLANGRELWTTDEGFGLTVSAGDGLALAVTNDSRLVAYGLHDGAERWSVLVTSQALDDIVLRDGLVYLAETGRLEDIGQRESAVRVFDAASGRFLGSVEPPGTSFSPFLALVEAPDRLILPSFQLGPVLIEFIAERHGASGGQ